MRTRTVYVDGVVHQGLEVAPLVGEPGHVPLRRPGQGLTHDEAMCVLAARWAEQDAAGRESIAERAVRLGRDEVRPGMRCVDGVWLYSAAWL